MAKKRNRITAAMSKTIADSSPLIKKTKTLSQEQINKNNINEVQIKNLQSNPFQPRIEINPHSLNELISSIEQNGLLQPIIITEASNNMHTIIAGHRRYEAHKIMGKDKIQATIIKDITDKDLAVLSLTENLMRENLHPIENAIAIKNILDNKIVESQNKLAEYVGFSKGYVSKLMNILKLPTTIIQTIKQDNYKDINILVLINKLDDEELMHGAYQSIKNLPRNEAEKYIKHTYFSKQNIDKTLIDVKSTKSKISVNIDIKKLSPIQIKAINDKIEALNSEINALSREWGGK